MYSNRKPECIAGASAVHTHTRRRCVNAKLIKPQEINNAVKQM